MDQPIISLKNVAYRYPDGNAALEGLNLEIGKGEAVAVVGPNGAGKSTLLQVIAGLIPVSEGTLTVMGREVDGDSVERPHELEWLRRKLGIVFQDSDVALFNSTVWNDVIFGPLHMGLSTDEIVARGERALQQLGITHLKDRAPYRMSGGEKRKVSIASVLSLEPEIILFDEPTSDLDPRSRRTVIDLLKRMSAEGRTVIVATHDVNAVPDFAKRIVVLKRSILATGDVRTILSDETLLDESDLDVPQITRLFKVLSSIGYVTNELPFSLDEAVEQIMRRRERVHVHPNVGEPERPASEFE
jgi:cobalt/nickel transport system ATP-binding protein